MIFLRKKEKNGRFEKQEGEGRQIDLGSPRG